MNLKKFEDFDVVALRRMGIAREFLFREDKEAAADVFRSVTEDWPEYAPAWFELGRVLGRVECFETYLQLDPEDVLGAAAYIALNGKPPEPEIAPAAYVEALFDDYADRFEDALLNRLDYQAPSKLADDLGERTFASVLDLGCGTGLMGEALKSRAIMLTGVDLSSEMLRIAGEKGIYAQLHVGEVHEWLKACNERFDLVIAADVFSYIGVLDELIMLASAHLNENGILAFTVEKSIDERDWYIRETLRYAHSHEYVVKCLENAELEAVQVVTAPLRNDRGNPIEGLYVLARKPV